MDDLEIQKLFDPLFADLRGPDSFPNRRPLLAHYTPVTVLEAILRHDEAWLSNPLFMNDLQEVHFGINAGVNLFVRSPEIESACRTTERFNLLRESFIRWYYQFVNEHVLDLMRALLFRAQEGGS
jgi:hypothetical protein